VPDERRGTVVRLFQESDDVDRARPVFFGGDE
jgi:hypothetical protein